MISKKLSFSMKQLKMENGLKWNCSLFIFFNMINYKIQVLPWHFGTLIPDYMYFARAHQSCQSCQEEFSLNLRHLGSMIEWRDISLKSSETMLLGEGTVVHFKSYRISMCQDIKSCNFIFSSKIKYILGSKILENKLWWFLSKSTAKGGSKC